MHVFLSMFLLPWLAIESRDGRLWKYESMIIICASITIIAIIGYLTYVCRFHSTIKLILFICWVNIVENWFRCDSTENLKLWHNNHYFCDHDMAIFRQYDYHWKFLITIIMIIKILPIPNWKPTKLDYCFITSTSLLPVAVSQSSDLASLDWEMRLKQPGTQHQRSWNRNLTAHVQVCMCKLKWTAVKLRI